MFTLRLAYDYNINFQEFAIDKNLKKDWLYKLSIKTATMLKILLVVI